MKICIAGGGRVGRYLAQSLLANHHSVVIIEPIEAQCRMLADQLDIPVICGDSISMDILRTADAASCDAFVAVTGSDEDNLIACQLAKREFGVDRTVARASNPNRDGHHPSAAFAGGRHRQPERDPAAGKLRLCRQSHHGHSHPRQRHLGQRHPRH